MIALIPARAGSKRCPGKNTRLLAGRPLLDWTIFAALDSGVFNRIIVATDLDLAWGGDPRVSFYWRLPVRDDQLDIEWVREVLAVCPSRQFAILRPTSPFRTADTIRRCYREFQQMADCGDSIRAVEPVTQNPYKMWTYAGAGMPIRPLLDVKAPDGTPYHSMPTQLAPTVYIQNSSLEMAHTANVEVHGTIHGKKVGPFFTQGYEGFNIDTEADWREAERLITDAEAVLPPLSLARV